MRVKKFEAKNMKEALRMVKNELGPDAVILSARDNRKSFGINGQASVEITAAVSESTLQKKRFVESRLNNQDRERFNASDARTQRQFIDKMVDKRNQRDEEKPRPRPMTTRSYIDIQDDVRDEINYDVRTKSRLDAREDFYTDASEESDDQRNDESHVNDHEDGRHDIRGEENKRFHQMSQRERQDDKIPANDRALSRIRDAARDAWRAGIVTAKEEFRSKESQGGLEIIATSNEEQVSKPQPQVTNFQDSVAKTAEIASLKGEIDRLHKVLEGFQKVPQAFVTMHPGAEFGLPYELSFMFQKLTEVGISVDHTVEILKVAANEIDPIQIKKRPIVDAWVARFFLSNIQVQAQPWSGRMHLFVGGSSSGKTSSLIKIASHLVVKEKKKIAILTTDSFKVGAVDQLKIYCQILNVPFAIIRNRNDWNWILGQLGNIDHVLVDFPGSQLKDIDEIQFLKTLLPPSEASAVCHLCISANTKDSDAIEIARRYKVTEFNDLIFTSLDQSVQHGIIYNLHKKTGKPLHSFGVGSRIPEDFEAASKERVLDLIFKLTRFRREMK